MMMTDYVYLSFVSSSMSENQYLYDPISNVQYKERPIQDLGGLTFPNLNKRPHFGPGNKISPEGPFNKEDAPTYYHDVMYGKYGYFDKEADDLLMRRLISKYPQDTALWKMNGWDQLAIDTFLGIQEFYDYRGAHQQGRQNRAYHAKIIGLEQRKPTPLF